MPPDEDVTVDAGEGMQTLAGDATLDPDGPDPGPGEDTAVAGHSTQAGVVEATPAPRGPPKVGLSPGGEVGRYVVLDRVGAGAMGEVYAAYDPELDRRVALKVLRPERSGSPHRRARLLREAQSIARLDHPNVIGVYDVGEVDGKLYLAMEFADGGTLTRWLSAGQRAYKDVLAHLCAAGAGLAAAHRAGVVHRDFKPDNVLLTSDGRVKVADFGIARLASTVRSDPSLEEVSRESKAARAQMVASHDQAMTKTGDTIGTPLYMAPEQHALSPGDERSDQYAFCVTCWEALTGGRPFRGNGLGALVAAKLDERIDEPADTNVPGWILRLLRRGLASDPEARWPSVSALVAKLQDDPARRRRRWLGLAGLLGAGALLGAVPGWTRPVVPDDPCPSSEAELAEIYGPTRRQAVSRAFDAVDAPWGPSVGRSTLESLDGWAAQWVEINDRSCRATWLEHDASLELLEARRVCLAEAAGALDKLVTWVEGADPSRLREAVKRASSLPRLDSCWTEAELGRWLELPEDPARRAEAMRLRDDIAAFKQEIRRMDPSQRKVQGAALVDRAIALQMPTLEADVRLHLAQKRAREGDAVGARAEYETMLWDAIARDDVRSAYSAALEMLWIDGYVEADHERARSSQAAAQALLLRMGSPVRRRAALLSRMGAVLYAQGDLDGSMSSYQTALDLVEPRTLADRMQHADIRFNLASVRIEVGQYDGAIEQFDELEQMWAELVGADHPELVSVLTNRSITYQRLGDNEAAERDASRAWTICTHAAGASALQCSDAGRSLAETRWRLGQRTEAIETLTRSYELASGLVGVDNEQSLHAELVLAHWLARQGRADELRRRSGIDRGETTLARQVEAILGALTKEASGDLPGADQALAEVLEDADGSSWAHAIASASRARVLATLGRHAEAAAEVAPSADGEFELEPFGQAYAQLAWIAAQMGSPTPPRDDVQRKARAWHAQWVKANRLDVAFDLAALMAQHGWTP